MKNFKSYLFILEGVLWGIFLSIVDIAFLIILSPLWIPFLVWRGVSCYKKRGYRILRIQCGTILGLIILACLAPVKYLDTEIIFFPKTEMSLRELRTYRFWRYPPEKGIQIIYLEEGKLSLRALVSTIEKQTKTKCQLGACSANFLYGMHASYFNFIRIEETDRKYWELAISDLTKALPSLDPYVQRAAVEGVFKLREEIKEEQVFKNLENSIIKAEEEAGKIYK